MTGATTSTTPKHDIQQEISVSEPTNADPDHRKPCTLCLKPCNVRIRCQIDSTGKWHLVCPGKCWTSVSGGVIDGDKDPAHKFYRYGGVWKNKHDAVSGKIPKGKKKQMKKEAEARRETEREGVAEVEEGDAADESE